MERAEEEVRYFETSEALAEVELESWLTEVELDPWLADVALKSDELDPSEAGGM